MAGKEPLRRSPSRRGMSWIDFQGARPQVQASVVLTDDEVDLIDRNDTIDLTFTLVNAKVRPSRPRQRPGADFSGSRSMRHAREERRQRSWHRQRDVHCRNRPSFLRRQRRLRRVAAAGPAQSQLHSRVASAHGFGQHQAGTGETGGGCTGWQRLADLECWRGNLHEPCRCSRRRDRKPHQLRRCVACRSTRRRHSERPLRERDELGHRLGGRPHRLHRPPSPLGHSPGR